MLFTACCTKIQHHLASVRLLLAGANKPLLNSERLRLRRVRWRKPVLEIRLRSLETRRSKRLSRAHRRLAYRGVRVSAVRRPTQAIPLTLDASLVIGLNSDI